MDRERIQQLSIFVEEIYYEIEQAILVNAAVALSKDSHLLDEDVQQWRLSKLSELGQLNKEHIAILARYSGRTAAEIKKMLKIAGMEEAADMDGQLKALVPEVAATVPAVANSALILGVLSAYEAQALQTYNLINTTMLGEAQHVYLDIVNTTVAKVLTGVLTPQQALRQTTAKWAEKGIPALIRKDGARMSVEGYVPMVTRTTVQNVTNGMQDARMDEYDIDLVEVSSHMGARPRCAPFQGKVYSRSGKSKLYPPLSSTSIGEPSGLFGINCGHVKYPYVHGKSTKRYKPYNKAENDFAYKQSQKQRELERQIRKAKKEQAMMEALGDEQGIKEAKVKVRERQATMRQFIQDTGRTRRRNREQIVT